MNSSPSPVQSMFCTDKTVSVSGKILNHDSVSVIVSWFTILVEEFVTSRYQVTKLFCSR